MEQNDISRREFLKSAGVVAGGVVMASSLMGMSGCATSGAGATAGIGGASAKGDHSREVSMWNQIRTDEYEGMMAEIGRAHV